MSDAYVVPETCPQCDHEPVTEIIYGLVRKPSKALQADIRAGRKVLGGCVTTEGVTAYICRACGWKQSIEDANHPLAQLREHLKERYGQHQPETS